MNKEIWEQFNNLDYDQYNGRMFFHKKMRPDELYKIREKELYEIIDHPNFSTLFTEITGSSDYKVTPMYRMVLTLLEYISHKKDHSKNYLLTIDRIEKILFFLTKHPDAWKIQFVKTKNNEIIREKSPMVLLLECNDLSDKLKKEVIDLAIKRNILEIYCNKTKSTLLHSICIGISGNTSAKLFSYFLSFCDESFLYLARTGMYSQAKDTPLSLLVYKMRSQTVLFKREIAKLVINRFPAAKKAISDKTTSDDGFFDHDKCLNLLNQSISDVLLDNI